MFVLESIVGGGPVATSQEISRERDKKSAVSYGGQALIEGVMMRGPGRVAIAIRRRDGQIAVRVDEYEAVQNRWPVLRLPIVRGVVALIESLVVGINALMYSANQTLDEDEQLTRGQMTVTVVVALVVALAVFAVFPTWVVGLVRGRLGGAMAANIVEGVIRTAILLGYLWAISLMPDVRRLLEYHGAEHKSIHTYEDGASLTVAEARSRSTRHPRCGTSFLLVVALVGIIIFAFFGWPALWLRIVLRLLLLPVVAGVSYEFIRLAGRSRSPVVRWASWPGLALQGLTTREPDDEELEVGLAALAALLEDKAALEWTGAEVI